MDEFSEQSKLLGKYRIETEEQLVGVVSDLEEERDRLIAERKSIGCWKRRTTDEEKIEVYVEKGNAITVRLSEVRKRLKLGESVLIHSQDVHEKMEQVKANNRQKTTTCSLHHSIIIDKGYTL